MHRISTIKRGPARTQWDLHSPVSEKATRRYGCDDIEASEQQRRRKLRYEAILAAAKFHQERPDQAALNPEWAERTRRKAKRVRMKLAHSSPYRVQGCTITTSRWFKGLQPTDALIPSEEMEIDMDRTEEMKATFMAEFAKGRRPGVVIPRLQVLKDPPAQTHSS
ncbi:hypothetical protein NM688_g9297 [Phlebia brevispora]|uniref:Uncharacterized protein n=1 Tax=Phlebia brevispora TaxID=194682 RepID=A0ACC1RHV9_9APHY|nr:hypothetical protein NM688_g9297 [Phlebia brevispora]